MLKKTLAAVLLLCLAVIIYLGLKKSPVDPVAYDPPKAPDMTGVLEPNTLLQKAELIAKGKLGGPEEAAVDDTGRIYCGIADGKIVRILQDGSIETFAETGGRPLGMKFHAGGNLVVCDAYKGLLSVNKKGVITVLAVSAEGTPFNCTDALDIARNGIIYFTDASDKFKLHDYVLDMVEMRPHGRVMSYNPATKKVMVLMKDLCFANGVALSKNEDFILVSETYKYRIHRYWLKGSRARTSDIFIDNLPGFPDNVSSNRKGTFWLALFSRRNSLMDIIHGYPVLKSFLGKLPPALWARASAYGFVVSLNEKGEITGTLQDPTGDRLKEITSAQEYQGYLYLGSLHADSIGKYKL